MTIFYRILSVDDKEHTFGVRYWSDKISEKELRMDERDEHDPPIRCRTDYNLTAWNTSMTADEIHDYIVNSAPADWFNLKETAKEVETPAMKNAKTLVGISKEVTFLRPNQTYLKNLTTLKKAVNSINVETTNFLLKSLAKSDINENWVTWMNDPAILRVRGYGHYEAFTSVDDLLKWFNPYVAKEGDFGGCIVGIYDKKTNKLIGFMLFSFDYSKNECVDNSLYIVDPTYRNTGTYNEIRGPLAKLVFGDLQIQKISVHILDKNDFLINSLIKRGWVQVDSTSYKDNGNNNVTLYTLSRTREDWLSKEGKDYKAT